MKANISLILFGIIWINKCYAHKNEQTANSIDTVNIIKGINQRYARINLNTRNSRVLENDLVGETTENGFTASYINQNNLQKITVTYYKETGKLICQYFYAFKSLFFVSLKSYSYNMPIYTIGSKVSLVTNEKFYFDKGKLIAWVNGQRIERYNSIRFADQENEMLKDAEKLRISVIGCKNKFAVLTASKDTLVCKYGSDCPLTGYVLKGTRSSCGAVIHVKPKYKTKILEH